MGNRLLFPGKSAIELLVEFRESGSQEPYEEIVRRYAAMVYGVCLRVTGDKHDAEDATQAVFLSLALQAKTSREIKYLGPWLQKVAHRLALDVKKSKTRRKRREEKLADQARHSENGNGFRGGIFAGGNGHADPSDGPGSTELKGILMEELNKLPPKYRMPLVMHYFGGLSREEMAEQLKCNPSTLGVRVHRGKALLGTRLAKRGVAISAVALGVVLEHVIRSGAMQPMIATASTSAAASPIALYAANGHSAASAAMKVMSIFRIASKSVAYAKLKYAVVIALVIGSISLTSTGAVTRFIKTTLHLPIPIDLGNFIRPLLKSIFPDPLASATPADERPEDNFPLATRSPQPVRIDWDKAGLPGANTFNPAPPTFAAPAPALSAVANATPTPAAPIPGLRNEFALTSIHSGMFDPPPSQRLSAAAEDKIGFTRHDSSDVDSPVSVTRDSEKPLLANSDELLIGAGGGAMGGKPDVYTLPANMRLSTQSQVIGDSGFGIFRQQGGVNEIAGSLTLGRKKGSVGTYVMQSGTLTAQNEVIGDAGEGHFIQYAGKNIAQDSIIVGNMVDGTYVQIGGETSVRWTATSADTANDPGGLHLGETATGDGTYTLRDGTLTADPQIIGVSGKGNLTQTGGKNITGAIDIAAKPGSKGQYNLSSGTVQIEVRPANAPDATIRIGGAGDGAFYLGNGARTGSVFELGNGGSVIVRGTVAGDGLLSGWGKVDLKGALVNNSQVVADGYRSPRTLDLSSFGWVTSTIENQRWGGTSGWFARREGKLTLPPLAVKAGTSTATWGEDNGDPMIDLVNSVRLTMKDAQEDGEVSISLLSTLRDDIPALPEFNKFIGVWSFDTTVAEFESVSLQVRYDDGLAESMGLDEGNLKLWQYNSLASSWQRINDSSFIRDTLNHILTGTAGSSMTYFAVSAPEPGSATIVLIGAAGAMMRRRRK